MKIKRFTIGLLNFILLTIVSSQGMGVAAESQCDDPGHAFSPQNCQTQPCPPQ
jgi:hypothetical protein